LIKHCSLEKFYASYLFTYLITYLLFSYLLPYLLSPSLEVSWISGSQEFSYILLKPKIHFRIHNCPPTAPNLIHLNPWHTSTSHFLKIHLNYIVPSTLGSPKWNLSLCFLTKTLYMTLQTT
jgi:hypothetical protein